MQKTAGLADAVSIDTRDWEDLLCAGAQEVFEMMIGVPLKRCPERLPQEPGEFAAVIGLAGPICGVFAIRCDEKTAVGIACGMLGMEEDEARAEIWDALGEVCNMVVGNFKSKTGKLGESSVLSVPTVIHGHDYKVRPLIDGSLVECRMQSADGVLHLRLDYRLAG
ncbi:MAG: chemotaxis protein CheX [Candidatus Korobacteraceae bacterium]|jgi:chemotaxis protein CheX